MVLPTKFATGLLKTFPSNSLQKETKEDCDQWTLFFVAASSANCLAFRERERGGVGGRREVRRDVEWKERR